MTLFKQIIAVLIGFSSGVIVAGGIFAFIAVIGVVPRLAQRTKTIRFIPLYEDAIMVGGLFGTTTMFLDYYLPVGSVVAVLISLCIGVFFGCLAVSLAEVLNVIPIFARRSRLTIGIPAFILAMAVGKLIGALLYALVPGFYTLF